MGGKAKARYSGSILLPRLCFVCGNPPAPEAKWTVKGTKSEQKWSRTIYTTLSLESPMCRECHLVSKNSPAERLLSCLGIPVAAAIAFVGIALLATGSLESGLFCVPIALVALLSPYGIRELGNLISQRGLSPDQRQRRNKRVL